MLRHLAGDGQGRRLRLERALDHRRARPRCRAKWRLLDREHVLGFVTEVGGRTSHSAIVARGRGIPAVVSVRGILQQVKTGDIGAVDGYSGAVEINPDAETAAYFRARGEKLNQERAALAAIESEPAVTADGRRIDLGANIELPEDAEGVRRSGADSIGLFRTEFFYLNRLELPDEEEQYVAYRAVAERWRRGR